MKLADKKCIPCEGGMPAFSKAEVAKFLPKLSRGWRSIDDKKILKEFKFKNFVGSMGFANQIALIAQAEDHHPNLYISYKKVIIELMTHAVGGLSENDFILAAKIDQI
ncbi:MAG: 4a-hydroxytetrahydrobiopterin dehydratase [Candidatus Doudnabacteria bacterium RIFCSPLOWO2_01_FULL_44_21]|uniref:Putative pterin-4-alpha-carbinolamine dehydratase n=1 Tax=Candidatus Doudnabacteria bacterium RIFCSPLOWO2_01_FULL_44_21 TaxID=1817841 RepID=A0A1F5Q5E0_9BACT|nr:MAG: 4a-hydroxytetrahydrobiopterin dehydratase [Candidatus Doudnabacteria bacterium RIFCSPHIGHO2_02_FULL_43_13b]OGE97354.1 MAG: 4a-hydroxytetrahydrobiopterin dehydratase [Candidatus Doudnabacteria bacterium RIFCSPLOWO2_01_FULL_44_21]